MSLERMSRWMTGLLTTLMDTELEHLIPCLLRNTSSDAHEHVDSSVPVS